MTHTILALDISKSALGSRLINLTGERFGRLVVTGLARREGKHTFWTCQCECGATTECRSNSLRRGRVKSCGCLKSVTRPGLRHGMSHTPTHRSWLAMRARCTDPAVDAYPHYGGRGITVCDRWMGSFEEFLEDMGMRPDGTTIERIDSDGNYAPGNCRWATKTEQIRNRRNTRLVRVNGTEVTLAEACVTAGLPYTLVHTRMRRGWTAERALAVTP